MTASLTDKFISARAVSTPLIYISTTDPAATVASAYEALVSSKLDGPKVQWDCARGVRAIDPTGKDADSRKAEKLFDIGATNPTEMLMAAFKLPEFSILFAHNLGRFLDPVTVQAIWNLRDEFKHNRRTLVILGPSGTLPPELTNDVLVLDEPLPSREQLESIVRRTHVHAKLEVTDEGVARAVEAVQGLAAFPAEQATAMSLRKSGLDLDDLWERKRQMIEQTPGLKVYRTGEKFTDIGGVENIKASLRRIMNGKNRPNAVVFIDEIEKAMAGVEGDMSGTSQDQLGVILTYMQDHCADGMIFVGPPGAAKSAVAKAAGNEAGVPTIQLDLGATKGNLVGQSEQQIRSALKTITAVSNDRSLWIATCNSIGILKPELMRRFADGKYFFDLPDDAERAAIWRIWRNKFEIDDNYDLPDDVGWTGAEIRQCCKVACYQGMNLEDAAEQIVPVCRSAAGTIERLRRESSGVFLNASRPGVYEFNPHEAVGREAAGNSRRFDLSEK